MTTGDISALKAELRTAAKVRRRKAFDRDGPAAAQKIKHYGVSFTGCTAPAVVSAYMPIRDELDVRPLMDALVGDGYSLALPVIIEKGQPLEFRAWQQGAALGEVQWQIQEPGPEAEVVAPDIVLCPLLAFDEDGYRLGYGGGFYDRSLSALGKLKSVMSVGVAFDEQRVDAVPHDAYDQRLDWILTPSGPHKCNSD